MLGDKVYGVIKKKKIIIKICNEKYILQGNSDMPIRYTSSSINFRIIEARDKEKIHRIKSNKKKKKKKKCQR